MFALTRRFEHDNALLLVGGLLAIYVSVTLFAHTDLDLEQSPGNAFFDMDVTRVIEDLTTANAAERSRTHPLVKYLSPPGIALRALGVSGEYAAGAFCLLGVLAQVAFVYLLARRMELEESAALLAAGLTGASFCSFLLAAIPDMAALSGLFSLLPFLLLYTRNGKPLTWWETAAWVALAIGGFGVTISQLLPCGLALLARAVWLPRAERRGAGRFAAVGVVATALLIWGGLELQEKVFAGTEQHYKINKIIEKEFKFFETEQLSKAPVERAAKLASHIAVRDFFAPMPEIVEWSPPRDERRFLSISLVDAGLGQWTWWQAPLLVSQFALLILVVRFGRWQRAWWPMGLAVALQWGMHFVYGREFVIYALNWHPLLVLLMVAAIPSSLRQRPWFLAWLGAHCVMMAINNAVILQHVFWLYDWEFPYHEALELIRSGTGSLLS